MSFDELPQGWKLRPLEDVMEAIIDYRGKTPKKTESGIPLITAKIVKGGYVLEPFEFIAEDNYDSWMVRGLPKVGDVVLTTEAPLGETAQLTSANVALAQRIVTLRGKKGLLNNDFLLCALQSDFVQHQLESRASGSTVKGIKQSELRKVSLPIPPMGEQLKISSILKSLSNKLVCNIETNQTLEEMAQALFKSWFVDFDPVKAKMNGEQPEGMDAATASLFPEKLVESELGLIPEGWKASSMGEHFNITMGQSPKGETYNEDGEGIAFFQGRRDFGFRYPDVRVYTTDPKRYAKAGDTLISVRAPVGDKNMADIDCCIGRGVAAIKHKSGSRSFTYSFVSHIEKKLSDSGSSGTVFSSINQNELKKFSFVAPPQALIEAFHKLVDPIDQKVQVLSGEIKSLSELRDTLLPKLLSGEIDLAETTI